MWASLAPSDADYGGRTEQLSANARPWLAPPRRLARRIDALAERCGAPAVWAVAHGALVPTVAAVAQHSSLPVHISIHDDPAWSVAFRGRRQKALTPWIHHQFGLALRHATSVDFVSGGMRATIASRSGRDGVIVHRVLDDPVAPNESAPPDDRLTIGLLGSVYAPQQLKQLTAMLAEAASMVDRPACLMIIGRDNSAMRRAVRDTRIDVQFLGHVDEDEGVAMLRGTFALHIGYPFTSREKTLRRTSFPAKLATYVQAARPLLVHAPHDSSLAPLFGFCPFVIPWSDQDIHHGARTLAAAWRTPSLRASQHHSAEIVRRRYFGIDSRHRLFGVLNQLVDDGVVGAPPMSHDDRLLAPSNPARAVARKCSRRAAPK